MDIKWLLERAKEGLNEQVGMLLKDVEIADAYLGSNKKVWMLKMVIKGYQLSMCSHVYRRKAMYIQISSDPA